MKHRYVVEDVPHAMVPMAELGDLLNIPTPATDAIIELSSISNEVNYWKEGTTLKTLELAGLTPKEIFAFLETGEK
jgi:opine dehydrogenase